MSKQIVEEKVYGFVATGEAFTSVDVANAIKRDGEWVRNREVASWLRSDFLQSPTVANGDYVQTMIDVGQGYRANLYHPFHFDVTNYAGKNQKALNPDEFNALHPQAVIAAPVTPVAVPASVASSGDDEEEQDFNENSRTVSASVGRVWIPASIVTELGYAPGDIIPSQLLGISTSKDKLTVHYDGRVTVMASKVGSFADGDKITVYVKDNKVVYDTNS